MLRLFLDRDEDGRVLHNVAKVSECRSDKFGESGLKAKTLSPDPLSPLLSKKQTANVHASRLQGVGFWILEACCLWAAVDQSVGPVPDVMKLLMITMLPGIRV